LFEKGKEEGKEERGGSRRWWFRAQLGFRDRDAAFSLSLGHVTEKEEVFLSRKHARKKMKGPNLVIGKNESEKVKAERKKLRSKERKTKRDFESSCL